MKHQPVTRERALSAAKHMKQQLIENGIPIVDVMLFGSSAGGKMHHWSDVDIAVVYNTFSDSRDEEHSRIWNARDDFSVPMDILCLYPEDLNNKYWGAAQEVKKHGIRV